MGVTSSKAMTVAIPSRASTTGSQALSCHRGLWRAGIRVWLFECVFVSSSVKVSLENLCHLMSQCVSVTCKKVFVFICCASMFIRTGQTAHPAGGLGWAWGHSVFVHVCMFDWLCACADVWCVFIWVCVRDYLYVLWECVSNYRPLTVAFVLSSIMTLPHTREKYYYCNASTHCCCFNDCCAATDAAATAATHTHKHAHKHTNTPHTVQIPARASTAEVQITSISQYKLGTKLWVN